MSLPLRREAAQATFDAFHGRAFKWGERDCARLAAFALRQAGYNPRLARVGAYGSLAGARAALKRLGYADLGDALDELKLPRIAPAAALPGDIVGFDHPDMPMLGLGVVMRTHLRVLAFLDDGLCHVGPPKYGLEGATYLCWRVQPCRS